MVIAAGALVVSISSGTDVRYPMLGQCPNASIIAAIHWVGGWLLIGLGSVLDHLRERGDRPRRAQPARRRTPHPRRPDPSEPVTVSPPSPPSPPPEPPVDAHPADLEETDNYLRSRLGGMLFGSRRPKR